MDEKYDIQGAQSYTVILAEPAVQLGLSIESVFREF